MAPSFLVAQEQVLGLGARELRHEPLRLLHGHHGRMLVARGVDAMLPQEFGKVHQRSV
jgi:hypothetical protein